MKNHKLIFKSIVAVGLLLSLGTASTVSSAHHVHYGHPRVHLRAHHKLLHRRLLRHRRGKIAFHKKRSIKHKTRPNKISQNCSEIYHQTIYDVNKDRRHYKLSPLKVNCKLSKIGDIRSHQLQKYFSHNIPRHKNETEYLLKHNYIRFTYYGENISSCPLGTINTLDVGPYNSPNDAHPCTITYKAKNGYQLANNINNASMNHDEGDQNGHRDNDLDRKFKQIGVGVSYNKHNQNFCTAVEFTNASTHINHAKNR